MKILFNTKMNAQWSAEMDNLGKLYKNHEFSVYDRDRKDMLGQAEVVIGGVLTEEEILSAPELKLIIIPYAGVNKLPMDLLDSKNIRVANSHGNSEAVAERVLALIMAFYGKIVSYHNDLREGQWHGFWVGKGLDDTWESIRGKSCSIIGAGSIGRCLADLLVPFKMKVTGYKRSSSGGVPDHFDSITTDLDIAVEESEIIVIALPSTDQTRNLFDRKRLEKMKNKVIINVGRGDIIDQEALYGLLKDGTLKGAAVDCWYNYPTGGRTTGFPGDYPFQELGNIVLSPHVAGFNEQAANLNISQAFENLKLFLDSGKLKFEVDTKNGY